MGQSYEDVYLEIKTCVHVPISRKSVGWRFIEVALILLIQITGVPVYQSTWSAIEEPWEGQ